MSRLFHFAILKLEPNELRGESVNIGIVSFDEERTDIRITPQLKKIASLDPNISVGEITELNSVFSELVMPGASIEDRHALLSNFGPVKSSNLGQLVLHNQDDYEREIQRLLDKYVIVPRKKARMHHGRSRIQTELKAVFRKAKVLGDEMKDIDQHKVIPNFLISEDENLYADFALRNSKWHISETIDFRVSKDYLKNKRTEAGLKAITLDRATQLLGGDTYPIIVYASSPGVEDIIQPSLNMLSNYAETMFDVSSKDDRAAYVDHILRAAKIPQVHHQN